MDDGFMYASPSTFSLRSTKKCSSTSLKLCSKDTAATPEPVSTNNGRCPCSILSSPPCQFSSSESLTRISQPLHSLRFQNCTPKDRKTARSVLNCISVGC